MKNQFLVRHEDGWVFVATPNDLATSYGRREGFLSMARLTTARAAEVAGDSAVDTYGQLVEKATISIVPTTDAQTPYLGFWPADGVIAPNASGSPVSYRVVGLTVTEDDDGQVRWVPELDTALDNYFVRTRNWLTRSGNGTINGLSTVATLADGINPDVQRGRLPVRDVTFSKDIIELTESPGLPQRKVERLTMIRGKLEEPGTTSTTFTVKKNGSAITFAQVGGSSSTTTLTFTAGVAQLTAYIPTTDVVLAQADTLTVEITAAGDGAGKFAATATLAEQF